MGRHVVTVLYKALNVAHVTKQLAVKAKWDVGLREEIPAKLWEKAMTLVKQVSRNARLKYTQFNFPAPDLP
mgnify:CR=1 FL=1